MDTIVLHISFGKNARFIWAEASQHSAAPRKASESLLLPDQADQLGLHTLCQKYGLVTDGLQDNVCTIVVTLPTADNGMPLYSNHATPVESHQSEPAALKPWLINAVAVKSYSLLQFLLKHGHKDSLTPTIILGDDIRASAHIARYAANLITRGTILPHIHGLIAHWRPVYTQEDFAIREKFICAMPDSLRVNVLVYQPDRPLELPSIAPKELRFDWLITTFIDTMVRKSPGCSATLACTGNSLHEAYIRALCTGSNSINYKNEKEIASLAKDIQAWTLPIDRMHNSPYRLCITVREPLGKDSAEELWRISFHMQSVRDDAFALSLYEAFLPSQKLKALFKRCAFDNQEYILTALGKLAQLCPMLVPMISQQELPKKISLTTHQVYQFLTEYAQQLHDAGFFIRVPSWCAGLKRQTTIRATASIKKNYVPSSGFLSMRDIVDFDWKVSIGNVQVTQQELAEAATLQEPLVNISGIWMYLDQNTIQEALATLKRTQRASVDELVKWSLGWHDDTLRGITFDGISQETWLGKTLQRLEQKQPYSLLAQPEHFIGTLRPYQQVGFSWLAFLHQFGLGACLADDMGLGKTIQALSLLQHYWNIDEQKQPSLLVCPTSVTENWLKESQAFTPTMPVFVHHGIDRRKHTKFIEEASQVALVVTSYALLHRDYEYLQEVPWKILILDEAHNIKNAATKQSKAARSITAKYRIAMTGTPIENSIGDLWSIMEFLNPGFLGTLGSFKQRFLVPIHVNKDEVALKKLQQLTAPFILRRLKTDKEVIQDLPEKIETIVYSNLTQEQASLYQSLVQEIDMSLKKTDYGIARRGLILAALTKFKQICDHPKLFLKDNSPIGHRSGKLARLLDMVQEILSVGEKMLIFSQFASMGAILKDFLLQELGVEPLFLCGQTPKKERDAMINRFQNDPHGPPIFILSLKAGGVGLNLTAANHIFHIDRWWNPAVEDQATDRAFRIGQGKNVQVHKFVTTGTLEERIQKILDEKKSLALNLVGSSEQWITELDTAQLKNLFQLRRDALGE